MTEDGRRGGGEEEGYYHSSEVERGPSPGNHGDESDGR